MKRHSASRMRPGALGRWRDALVGAALLFGVAACTWQGIQPDGASARRLYISGDLAHVSDAAIAAIATPYLEAGFFDVDIAGLQSELTRQPWLTAVNVSRHWPDGVVIRVAEHTPIARWGEDSVLADDGRVFTPASDSLPQGLIRLAGPSDTGRRVYDQYQRLSAMLAGRDARIQRLSLDARGAWTATLADGLALRLGRGALAERMQRFVTYGLGRPEARDKLAHAGYVDLRYSDGFAVGGQRQANPTAQEQEKVDEQAA